MMGTIKFGKLILYFFIAGSSHALMASEIHSSHLHEVIVKHQLKPFRLIEGNTLHTNISNRVTLIKAINRIISRQDYSFKPKIKPYHLVLMHKAKADRIEGLAKENYVIVEGNFKKYKDYIRVISHELVHRYIGHLLAQPQENEEANKWFFEGFTEFFGVKTLFDTQFINEAEYVSLVNASLEEWVNHLSIHVGVEQLDRTRQPISYTKGFILALIIDEQLKQSTQGKYNLQTIINHLMSTVISKKTYFTLNLLIECLQEHLSQPFVEKILAATKDSSVVIKLLPNRFLAKHLDFKNIERYGNICFNVFDSLKYRKIQGVKLKSDCSVKGLKNHQALKCYSVDFNSGDIRLKVLDNEKEKIIHLKASKIKSSVPVYQ